MKKILSVLLAVAMLVSVGVSSAVVAMAAPTVASIESTTKKPAPTIGEVNGQTSTDVRYEIDPNDPNKITFTYEGEGELVGWEFLPDTFIEGKDYRIVSQDGNSITIELINGYNGDVIANAIVKFPEGEEPEEPTKKTTVKKNTNSKSPKTGVVTGAGFGVAAAGAAILVALKKKDHAE